jgi:hypothetical protein
MAVSVACVVRVVSHPAIASHPTSLAVSGQRPSKTILLQLQCSPLDSSMDQKASHGHLQHSGGFPARGRGRGAFPTSPSAD